MVLFANINLNQRVEILRAGRVYSGTVKYKGTINGESGDWVGIALDTPDGKHDGMLNARRYFLCPDRHGIFTTASQIRFVPLRRSLRNAYRTVDRTSLVEENLFTSNAEWPDAALALEKERRESYIDSRYRDIVLSSKYYDSDSPGSKSHPLRHSVGNRFPSAIMLRPDLERSKCFGSSPCRSPVHECRDDGLDFYHGATIPKPHIPHSALKRQLNQGWEGAHYTREMTVNTGRDAIKYSQWNDIST